MGAEMQDHLWRMLERFVVWIFLKTFVCSVEFLFYNSISAWSFFIEKKINRHPLISPTRSKSFHCRKQPRA
jgi:hypothetical protein